MLYADRCKALFPREYWPRSIRANGHLQLNGEKSKF